MDNKEYAKKLERRTKNFAIKIILLSSNLPNSYESKVIYTTKIGSRSEASIWLLYADGFTLKNPTCSVSFYGKTNLLSV